MSASIQEQIAQAVIEFNEEAIEGLVRQALNEGLSPQQIMFESLVPALDEVGRRYSAGDYFLAELLMCGDVVKQAMDILDPLFAAQGGAGRPGRLVIGTVEGDMHDIGKNMVVTMLKGSAYEVFDLGVNVKTEAFIEAVRQHKPHILALSALLLTTRQEMVRVIEALKEAGIRDEVKIIVGGSPVDQEFADRIGADGFGKDAAEAVQVANKLVKKQEA